MIHRLEKAKLPERIVVNITDTQIGLSNKISREKKHTLKLDKTHLIKNVNIKSVFVMPPNVTNQNVHFE